MATWPFPIPPETAVVTTVYITQSRMPILYVSHDDDENGGGTWQFHCGNEDYDGSVLQLVRLDEIYAIDEGVAQIADLRIGSTARRATRDSAWVIDDYSK